MKNLLYIFVFAIACTPTFSQDKNPLIVKDDFQNQKNGSTVFMMQ